MNPYGNTDSGLCNGVPAPGSTSGPRNNIISTLPPPPLIHTGHSSVTVLSHIPNPYQASGQTVVQPPNSSLPLLGSDPGPQSGLTTQNPNPAPSTPLPYQVSVVMPSPDLRPSPLPSQCSEESCPDLECSICFSEFNNIFRCPKMLQCKHTFCLECLARMNVKSSEPNTIQCPLCRGFTPLPPLGLPKLATDSDVLSCLPAAMQRVYSIRFVRNKGKLQVKRSSEGQRQWGQRSVRRSLDVGLPGTSPESPTDQSNVTTALFRVTSRPACQIFLMVTMVLLMVLLVVIISSLLIYS